MCALVNLVIQIQILILITMLEDEKKKFVTMLVQPGDDGDD